jgi:hypothetical protein
LLYLARLYLFLSFLACVGSLVTRLVNWCLFSFA